MTHWSHPTPDSRHETCSEIRSYVTNLILTRVFEDGHEVVKTTSPRSKAMTIDSEPNGFTVVEATVPGRVVCSSEWALEQ